MRKLSHPIYKRLLLLGMLLAGSGSQAGFLWNAAQKQPEGMKLTHAGLTFQVKAAIRVAPHNPEGAYRAGIAYLEGLSDEGVDLRKAENYLKQASDAGHSKASVALADLYRKGSYYGNQVICPDPAAAAFYYQRAQEDPGAAYGLAKLTPHWAEKHSLLTKAAEAGYPKATAQLKILVQLTQSMSAIHTQQAHQVQIDPCLEEEQALQVALQNLSLSSPKHKFVIPEVSLSAEESYALFQQAKMLNMPEAEVLAQKAAEQGHREAKYQWGKALLRQSKRAEAEKWFNHAAQEGHLKAKIWHALLDGGQSSQARANLRYAASRGVARAEYLWAPYHFRALQETELRIALHLIEEAAQNSYGPAQRWVRLFFFPLWLHEFIITHLKAPQFKGNWSPWQRQRRQWTNDTFFAKDTLFTSYPELTHWAPLLRVIRDLACGNAQLRKDYANAPTIREGLERCFPDLYYPGVLSAYDRIEQQAQRGDEEADLVRNYFIYQTFLGKGSLDTALKEFNTYADKEGRPGPFVMASILEQLDILSVLQRLEKAVTQGHVMGTLCLASVCHKDAGLERLLWLQQKRIQSPSSRQDLEGWKKHLKALLEETPGKTFYQKAAALGDSTALCADTYLEQGLISEEVIEAYYQAIDLCKIHGIKLGNFLFNNFKESHLKEEAIKVWQIAIDQGYGGIQVKGDIQDEFHKYPMLHPYYRWKERQAEVNGEEAYIVATTSSYDLEQDQWVERSEADQERWLTIGAENRNYKCIHALVEAYLQRPDKESLDIAIFWIINGFRYAGQEDEDWWNVGGLYRFFNEIAECSLTAFKKCLGQPGYESKTIEMGEALLTITKMEKEAISNLGFNQLDNMFGLYETAYKTKVKTDKMAAYPILVVWAAMYNKAVEECGLGYQNKRLAYYFLAHGDRENALNHLQRAITQSESGAEYLSEEWQQDARFADQDDPISARLHKDFTLKAFFSWQRQNLIQDPTEYQKRDIKNSLFEEEVYGV